jgi:hypothetical protein
MKITMIVKVKDGKTDMTEYEKNQVIKFLDGCNGKVLITFDSDVNNRSKAQNAFFHVVIVPATMRVLREIGHPNWNHPEYVKEAILKKPFLVVNPCEVDEYVRHTSDLKVHEMWRFINQCLVLIADLGGRLSPNEQSAYTDIVEHFGLGTGIDDAIERNI